MLNIDPIVKVDVHVGTSTASAGVFDVGAIVGSTAVAGKFDSNNRFKAYGSLAEMAADGFLTDSDEYKAAAKYFGVDPAPKSLVMIYCYANPVAEEFSATATYAVGDYVTHESKLYECTTAVTEAGAWDASDWTEVTAENETPVSAIMDAINGGAEFYAVYYIPAQSEADPNTKLRGIASAFGEMNRGVVFYGVVGGVDDVTGASGLFSILRADNTNRAVGLFCTESVDDAAGLMGEAMGLSRVHRNDAFSLCYKTVASATVNDLKESDVAKIKGVNGNVYIQRTRSRIFIENGATASGMRFDDVLYVDRMTHDIQQEIYDMIANSATKLPQQDSTTALFINAIHSVLEGYYNIGVLMTAPWRGTGVEGKLETGEYVEHGHAEFADSFTLQSEEDRLLHKAMPITVLLCLAGSVEPIEITVDVQT